MVIFSGLLCDLFPGVEPPRKRDMEFEDVIRATAQEMGLTAEDDFILRVVQLSELLAIRHCVFLMGPTGSGRTEAYKVGRGGWGCGLWGCIAFRGSMGCVCTWPTTRSRVGGGGG